MEGRLISPKTLAEMLDVSIKTIYNWIYLNRIPYHKCVRLVRFDRKEINDWLERNRVEERI